MYYSETMTVEELVEANKNLVHHVVKKFATTNTLEYEELMSEGMFGLFKAAITFNGSKGTKFSTYAGICITNECLMYLRKNKKQSNNISLEDTLNLDRNGNNLNLKDILPNPSNFAEELEKKETCLEIINIILNCLSGHDRVVALYRMAGLRQETIASMLDISRSYVSRLDQKSRKLAKKYYNFDKKPEGLFVINRIEEKYRIAFSSSNVKNFNQTFASVLLKLTAKEMRLLSHFKIERKKEEIIIWITADLESFYLLAKLIQEMDAYDPIWKANQDTILTPK